LNLNRGGTVVVVVDDAVRPGFCVLVAVVSVGRTAIHRE
jgi:hypothetical protein